MDAPTGAAARAIKNGTRSGSMAIYTAGRAWCNRAACYNTPGHRPASRCQAIGRWGKVWHESGSARAADEILSRGEYGQMTISIAGRCARTRMLGVAIASSSPCVAARCAFARAGVGAALSQNVTDPRLGQRALDLMQQGFAASAALKQIVAAAGAYGAYRQLVLVDVNGGAALHTGGKALGKNAGAQGMDCAAAGNLLADTGVPKAMAAAFAARPKLHLAERLLLALQEGLIAGGEAGPVKSAGLLVVDKQPWPLVDLRVDWDDAPVSRLAELWALYQPQMNDYVTRALDPSAAPAFGVPGDP